MKSHGQFRRLALSAVSLLLSVSIFGVAHSAEPAVNRIDLQISGRQVLVEGKTLRLTQGETVELIWTSDEAGELHLHGYDIAFDVSPDGPAVVRLDAHATGRFPVTSHGFSGEQGHGHTALLYIEVHPR